MSFDIEPAARANEGHWKVLLLDDDREVHSISRLVLQDIHFDGRGVEFLHAGSGREGMELFAQHPDIAVALIDMVMETDDAGLNIVKYVRDTLGNPWPRLIMRTGQPSVLPERELVIRYDIHDYRSKSDLSSLKLFTAVVSALRSYRDLVALERARKAALELANATMAMVRAISLQEFAETALRAFRQVLDVAPQPGGNGRWAAMFVAGTQGTMPEGTVVAATGAYGSHAGNLIQQCDPVLSHYAMSIDTFRSSAHLLAIRLRSSGTGLANFVIVVDLGRPITFAEKSIIEFFRLKAGEALSGLLHNEVARHRLGHAYRPVL